MPSMKVLAGAVLSLVGGQ
ncbi:hypothetical protein L195_g042754, partial [Trifolium pratense]